MKERLSSLHPSSLQTSFRLHPRLSFRRPEFHFRIVVNVGEESGESEAEQGMARVRREFGERDEDEAAQVQARVRQREKLGVAPLAAVEQEVEVKRARAAR